jgi:hypothetical protein
MPFKINKLAPICLPRASGESGFENSLFGTGNQQTTVDSTALGEIVNGAPEIVNGAPEIVNGAPEVVNGAPEVVNVSPNSDVFETSPLLDEELSFASTLPSDGSPYQGEVFMGNPLIPRSPLESDFITQLFEFFL